MKKIYCHTDVIFTDDNSIAVYKGKTYDILEINDEKFIIRNEQKFLHTFSFDRKKHHYYGRWFYTMKELRKQKLKKIKLLK